MCFFFFLLRNFTGLIIDPSLTGNANKLLSLHRDNLLLEETGATTLDTVQIIVDFVGAVKCDIQDGPRRHGVKLDSGQSSADNQLARLVTRRHIASVGGINTKSLNRLDNVDDSRATANADPASVFRVVVGDSSLCGGALGGFDGVGHCSKVAGEKEEGSGEGRSESRSRLKVKVEAGRLRKRTKRRGEAERRKPGQRHHEGGNSGEFMN